MAPITNPPEAAEKLVTAVREAVTGVLAGGVGIRGVPSSDPPSVTEPTTPRQPLPPKPDQRAPQPVSPTGTPTGAPESARAQAGAYLTTAQGVRVRETDHSLRAGVRGPTLLQDHHLREKVMHFDHERIPE